MFGKKLVLIAAAVALATGSVAATSESAHVKVEVATVHGHKQAVVRAHAHAVKQVSETAPPSDEDSEDDDSTDEDSTEKDDDSTEDEELDIEVLAGSDAGSNSSSVIEFCLDGWTEVSVDGVDSLFCVEGTPCTDSKEGECPAAQEGLEYGSYCSVKEGGKGCKPKTKEMWEKEQDEDSEDSEEGSNDDSEENSEDHSSAAEDDEDSADDSSAADDEEDSEEDSSAADEEDESEESEDAPATKKSHHKKSHKKDACAAGQSPMSVEGVEGVFCVSGQSCVAEIKGACPGPQANLQYGAYCDRVKTGVMGCKPKTKEMWEAEQKGGNTGGQCNGAGQSPMSVEGVEGIFCVSGQACVANIDGACPGPQAGLPYGSSCGIVKTGVKGCKPNAAPKKHHKKSHHKKSHKKDACAAGQSPMSVEGVEGVFCVSGQSCVAEIKGACPGPQANLQYGAYCDRVKTGVMGCKPKTKEMWEAEQKGGNTGGQCNGAGQSPMSVEGVEGIFCVSGQACVANIDGACPGPQAGLPYGSSCGIVKTGVKGCKPNAAPKKHHKKSHHKKSHKKDACAAGQSPMSVEGVEGVFCVSGQSCVAEIKGACPGPQANLQYGAYCDRVKTGVMGCKPKTKEMWEAEQKGGNTGGQCNGAGQSPMSVEGVEGIFCVSGQACVANIDGACPGPQAGLPYGSSCGIVKTGVKGCKPNAAPKKHHKKSHHKKSHKKDACAAGQSPMSVEGVEGVFCVSGQSCVAEIKGACPGPQANLQYGAYCDRVKTGVMGCKPKTKEMWEAEQKGGNTGGQCNGAGQSPMSVEGVEGIFCVSGQACVANIDGACPGPQAGLPYGSSCGIVKTGVKGCKPNAAPKKHHKKSHKKLRVVKKHSKN